MTVGASKKKLGQKLETLQKFPKNELNVYFLRERASTFRERASTFGKTSVYFSGNERLLLPDNRGSSRVFGRNLAKRVAKMSLGLRGPRGPPVGVFENSLTLVTGKSLDSP